MVSAVAGGSTTVTVMDRASTYGSAVSATANVVIIAAIITKVGLSTHDERHQATLGLLPRSLVTAITSCMLMSLSVKPAAIGGHAHVDAYPVAPDGIERAFWVLSESDCDRWNGLTCFCKAALGRAEKGLMKGSLTG